MFKRILTYSLVAILGLTLIGGTIVILTRPNDVEAYGGRGGMNQDRQGIRNDNLENEERGSGNNQSQGQGQRTNGGNQSSGGGGGQGQVNANTVVPQNWETITGVVLVSDSELTVDTGSTELLVGMGQFAYREAQGFVVNVGDEVRIEGYEEDGEFKAAVVENLSLGTNLVLRDASGRPMWSGQNARNSSSVGQFADNVSGGGYNGGGNGRGQGQGTARDGESYIVPESIDTAPLACLICDGAEDYNGPLTEAEVDALFLALNDEYHAWAVYEQVLNDFGSVRPFSNIQNAEAMHIAALTRLFAEYNLLVPENVWVGQLEGFESLGSACAAAVQAEVVNGGLYDTLLNSTERSDILDVYTALQRASLEQHLPAFTRCAD